MKALNSILIVERYIIKWICFSPLFSFLSPRTRSGSCFTYIYIYNARVVRYYLNVKVKNYCLFETKKRFFYLFILTNKVWIFWKCRRHWAYFMDFRDFESSFYDSTKSITKTWSSNGFPCRGRLCVNCLISLHNRSSCLIHAYIN